MYRGEIESGKFYAFINDHVEIVDWLEKDTIQTDKPLNIGIDQSSTCSGLYIQAEDLKYMTELPRGYMSVSTYKRALIAQLKTLLRGKEISHFIYEQHGAHITPLHSTINEITDVLKSYTKNRMFSNVKVKGILPTVWRKGFLDKTEYKNQFKREFVKNACYQEVVKCEPEMEKFKRFSSEGLDGFEAYGIINGYLNLNYDETGMRVVNTSMLFRNGRRLQYTIYKTTKEVLDRDIENLIKNRGDSNTGILKANRELLLENSINRVVGEYSTAIIIYEKHSEFCRFVFELDEVHNQGDMYLVFVKRL